jgi:sialate O-acetylesterase
MRRALTAALMTTLWLGFVKSEARADVKLPALFSDGMVLQSGERIPIWGMAEPGEKIRISFQLTDGETILGKSCEADKEGKWLSRIDCSKTGGPCTLEISGKNKITLKDVYIGEVWICSGQSNMEWPLAATTGADVAIQESNNPQLRLFTVAHATADERLHDVKGKWQPCNPETVRNFSAVGYYFGRELQKSLKVPVGLIHTSWGGTRAEAWTRREVLEALPDWKDEFPLYLKAKADYPKAKEQYALELKKHQQATAKAKDEGKAAPPAPKKPADPAHNPNSPSVLYNAMIAPLVPYGIKGAIWYQGESNAGQAFLYRKLFPAMIQNWRQDWKRGDFPFLFVQLAPWHAIVTEPQESAWAELREAQLLTSQQVPHTAMAVITDVGDPKDIHPRDKSPVGARLALAARAVAYGEPIEYSGPTYESMQVMNNKIAIRFSHVGKGLEARDAPLHGFAIAGEDHKFHNAQAEIRDNQVYVWCDQVQKPVAVRYGWANCPVVNLWNKDGLPASPFRTDDFPMVTRPKPSTQTK